MNQIQKSIKEEKEDFSHYLEKIELIYYANDSTDEKQEKIWDTIFEDPTSDNSTGDMAGERSGECIPISESCSEGCKKAMNDPTDPCHPKPRPTCLWIPNPTLH